MPNYKSFLVTGAERKHIRRRKRFQQHRDASCHQVFFPLQGKAPKEFHAILRETLGEYAPSYANVKSWVSQFKRGDFSTCVAPRPVSPRTVTTPEIIVQIHELIFEDRKISFKPLGEEVSISLERVEVIIHGYLYMRILREMRTEMLESGGKKVNCASRLRKFVNFSSQSKLFPFRRDW